MALSKLFILCEKQKSSDIQFIYISAVPYIFGDRRFSAVYAVELNILDIQKIPDNPRSDTN